MTRIVATGSPHSSVRRRSAGSRATLVLHCHGLSGSPWVGQSYLTCIGNNKCLQALAYVIAVVVQRIFAKGSAYHRAPKSGDSRRVQRALICLPCIARPCNCNL